VRLLVLLVAGWSAAAQTPAEPLRVAAELVEKGDMTGAIAQYRAFLKEYPDAAEIRSNLGAALVASARLEEAIAEYRLALEKMPNNPRVRTNLALAYYKVGKLSEALRELEVLHRAEPLEVKPVLLMADCLLQRGEAAKALELVGPLAEEYPEERSLAYLKSQALLKLKRPAEAKAEMERMVAAGESAESLFLLGQAEYLKQNPTGAEGYLKRAVELNGQLPGAHSLYGQVLRTLGRTEEAEAQFAAELKVNPYDFTANTEVAMARKGERKYDEALAHLARALQLRPTDAGVLLQRASIHTAQGKLEEARKELEALVKAAPEFSEAHAALATVYYKLKRTAEGDRERALARQK